MNPNLITDYFSRVSGARRFEPTGTDNESILSGLVDDKSVEIFISERCDRREVYPHYV